MRVRYKGTSPADNGDLGYIELGEEYDVPEGREDAFKNNPLFTVVRHTVAKTAKTKNIDESTESD